VRLRHRPGEVGEIHRSETACDAVEASVGKRKVLGVPRLELHLPESRLPGVLSGESDEGRRRIDAPDATARTHPTGFLEGRLTGPRRHVENVVSRVEIRGLEQQVGVTLAGFEVFGA
jgi:hypothetical protein